MGVLQELADIFRIALAPPKEVTQPVPPPPGRPLMAPPILPTMPNWLPTVPAPQATPLAQPLQVPTPPPRVPATPMHQTMEKPDLPDSTPPR
eukprot:9036474-Ditylum_brightwellii.AAC.1